MPAKPYIWIALLLSGWCPLWPQAGGPITWPTSNTAFMRGEDLSAFIQPTVSGRVTSGLYGCVRNDGFRFHEGIDLFPIFRTPNGEADEPVFAVMNGRVMHVNPVASRSGYGRYVVLEHTDADIPVYTLYSHLADIAEGVEEGVWLQAGDPVGGLGRSAAYDIPKSRAHVHFEIGLRIGNGFQGWYDQQDFTAPNHFGIWNGMNLVGFDPLAFFEAVRDGEFTSFHAHIQTFAELAVLRVHTSKIPDLIQRYPTLLTRPIEPGSGIAAWDIVFSQYGFPIRLTPWFAGELPARNGGSVELLSIDERLRAETRCWKSFSRSRDTYEVAAFMQRTLAILFEH